MKKFLFAVIGVILIAGCGVDKKEFDRVQAQLDSISSKDKDVKIDSLSGSDFSVNYSNENKTYFVNGKFWLVPNGIMLPNELANKIKAQNFLNVDGLTENQLLKLMSVRDSLRRENQK